MSGLITDHVFMESRAGGCSYTNVSPRCGRPASDHAEAPSPAPGQENGSGDHARDCPVGCRVPYAECVRAAYQRGAEWMRDRIVMWHVDEASRWQRERNGFHKECATAIAYFPTIPEAPSPESPWGDLPYGAGMKRADVDGIPRLVKDETWSPPEAPSPESRSDWTLDGAPLIDLANHVTAPIAAAPSPEPAPYTYYPGERDCLCRRKLPGCIPEPPSPEPVSHAFEWVARDQDCPHCALCGKVAEEHFQDSSPPPVDQGAERALFHSNGCPYAKTLLVGNCCQGNDVALNAMGWMVRGRKAEAALLRIASGTCETAVKGTYDGKGMLIRPLCLAAGVPLEQACPRCYAEAVLEGKVWGGG